MSAPLLTSVERRWEARMDDSVRIVVWSPGGRLLAVAADGTTMVDRPDNATTPMCGDPVGAVWVDERRLAVGDALGGLTFTGRGEIATVPVPGLRTLGSRAGTTVAAGGSALAVFRPSAVAGGSQFLEPGLGVIRALAPLSSTLWAVATAEALALVDVALMLVDTTIELAGLVSVAVDPATTVMAAGDATGSLHVFRVGDEANAEELSGYPDAVRLLGFTGDGQHLIAVSDDELTWWPLGPDRRAASEPVSAIAHDAAVTALACGPGLVASGDAAGELCVWSPRVPRTPLARLRLSGEITALAWSPTGDQLVAGTIGGQIVAVAPTAGRLA